ALVADAHLRAELAARWAERRAPWTDTDTVADPAGRARLQSARLIADGLWADSAIGLLTMTADERDRVRDLALGLIDAAAGRRTSGCCSSRRTCARSPVRYRSKPP